MKDVILEGYLKNFSDKFDYSDEKIDTQFEHFVNYNIVSKSYPREMNLDVISTGGNDDIGIDGVAILVNGIIIENIEEIEHIKNTNQSLDIEFILIQSKNRPNFEGAALGTFIFGVKNFFDNETAIPENDFIKKIRAIKEYIYTDTLSFKSNPILRLYFATVGEWKEPQHITGRVNRELKHLKDTKLFRDIKIEYYDAERLKKTYKELSRKITKEILFPNHVVLPDLPLETKVRQSFIGSVTIKDYIELISDEDGNLYRSLFYDNVRDYQGQNKVNKEIRTTLKDSSKKHLLPLLNNGITIISKQIDKVGQKIKLSDFQIVNGCQSSHILFEEKDNISNDLNIVVKVIETTNQDVINNIIIATNKQTEVKDEAFESIKPYHRDLEDFFKAKIGNLSNPIYYERRSKEYFNDPKIKNDQIITLAALTKAYMATVLEQPQSTHRYFGELISSNDEHIFKNKGMFIKYFISSFMVNKINTLFKYKDLKSEYKPYIYHIAYIIYLKLHREKFKDDDILNILDKKDQLLFYAINACKIIAIICKKERYSTNSQIRSKDFTNKIKDKINSFDFK